MLFNDVAASHWASGYINQASNLQIVKGVSAKEFAPDREVTVAEFVTMAVRALGAGQLVDAEGTWPTNYVNFANEEGILDDVNAIFTATASRLNAATIVANTLETRMWKKTGVKSNGEIEWTKSTDTIIDDVLKFDEVTFIADKVSNNDQEITVKVSGLTNTLTAGTYDVAERFDLTTVKVGLTYTAYIDEDNEIQGMWIDNEDTVEFDGIKKIDAAKDKLTVLVDGKEREYDYIAGNIVVVNEKAAVAVETAITAKNLNAVGTIYLNDDGKISNIYMTDYDKYSVVDEVTSTKVKMDSTVKGSAKKVNTTIDFSDEDDEYFLTKNGKGIKFSDLEEGDAIAYYTIAITGGTKYVGEVITDIVEGEVTAVNTSTNKVSIDKKQYDYLTTTDFVLEEDVKAWLDHAGKIVMFDVVEGAASDVAIVTYKRDIVDKYQDHNFEVKLLFTDGSKSETLTLDLVDIYEDNKLKDSDTYKVGAAGIATKEEGAYAFADTLLAKGMPVCYEISGSKLTVKEASNSIDKEFYEATGDLTVKSKSAYLNSVALYDKTSRVYVDENTKFIRIKSTSENDVKYEFIDFESLDTTTLGATSYIADVDYDNNYAGVVIFGEATTIARVSETNFAFVTEVTKAKYDGETVDMITVVYTDGKEATYYASDDLTASYDADEVQPGKLLDITVSGEELTEYSTLYYASAHDDRLEWVAGSHLVTEFLDGKDELTVVNTTNLAETKFSVADDVLVMQLKDGEYSRKSISDLKEYDYDDFKAGDELSVISVVKYYDDISEDAEGEIVCIIFANVKTFDEATAIAAYLTAEEPSTPDYTYAKASNTVTATAAAQTTVALGTEVTLHGYTFVCTTAGVEDSVAPVYTLTLN